MKTPTTLIIMDGVGLTSEHKGNAFYPVSYTHLTLPTILLV